MADLSFSDLLSLVQSIALIGALTVTLYFSRRAALAEKKELETSTLVTLDQMLANLNNIFIQEPALLKIVAVDPRLSYTRAEPTAYYTFSICSHAFRMMKKGVLTGTEWEGWLQWMTNAFRFGTLKNYWKAGAGMDSWFDPEFRAFVEKELLPAEKRQSS